jgi:transmembrane sensor
MENENETYLSDWLADKISDDQLKQLVSNDDFLAFQKLKNTLKNYTVSEPNMDENFKKIQQKLASKKETPSRKILPIWSSISIAASILLFIGLYQLYFSSNEFATDFGTTKSIVLNDHSKVTLNANSSVCYPNLFQFNRTIQLKGEAFFEVQKGTPFTVKTALGNITVLGTKFNVTSFDHYFEVVCYEGKVKVESQNKATILTHGESLRVFNANFENWDETIPQKPTWISGESSFKNVPMKYVLEKFKNQYHLEIDYPKNIETIKFTGSFTNSNEETALQSICIPLHLNYSNSSARKIIISK